ncbi:uncharacterized protein LOC111029879 isoform X2 [Myzus persicae]|uniref:uncharacterized protein LOC111029879 isoform X2 n=1 Tax=Myzus persicae TaxID=13164 RepID=UPI000B9325D1|nr:uncharacterized protein LOC111029879 isoform X2 [Myzus persicae]
MVRVTTDQWSHQRALISIIYERRMTCYLLVIEDNRSSHESLLAAMLTDKQSGNRQYFLIFRTFGITNNRTIESLDWLILTVLYVRRKRRPKLVAAFRIFIYCRSSRIVCRHFCREVFKIKKIITMNNDNTLFEFDAPKTLVHLYGVAKSNDDIADKIIDYVEEMESAVSKQNLEIVKKSTMNRNDVPEENKDNFLPYDQFDDLSINLLAYQLIRSAKKSKTSELPNRHSITVEGNEIELPKITHHAMITRLDELESTPKLDFCTHSVVKSEYKHHEHIKSGSKVFKSRCLFPDAFEPSISPIHDHNIIENKPTHGSYETKPILNKLNTNIPTSNIKPYKSRKKKVLNSQGGVQVVENKELAHSGIRVLEKQLNTIPKPFSFESRKLCATKPQSVVCTEQQRSFKARPATVLKKKPFVPKHEKKYTEPKNVFLNTERRAQEWMVFELEMKKKFSQYEENKRMRQEEMKKQELLLIKNLRQETIHKPEPIKKYKPVLIRKSRRPVTVPQSPRFSIRPNRNCLSHMSTT